MLLLRCTVAKRSWVLLPCEEERTADRPFCGLVLTVDDLVLVLLGVDVALTVFALRPFVETPDLVLLVGVAVR